MRNLFAKIKSHKKVTIIAVLIIAAVVFMTRGGSDASTANYQLVNPTTRDITVKVEGTGVLEPDKSRTIMAGVTGEVIASHYSIGDSVNAGDLIIEIDNTDAVRAIDTANETLSQANIAVEQAAVAVSSAQLSSQAASESASYLYVSSNFAGQVTAINFDEGDDIAVGSVVATVTDSKTALLKLQFHSADADLLYVGESAQISITSTGESLVGTVKEISAVENVGTGGILTRQVTFETSNPGGITETMSATAIVGNIACASAGTFEYNVSKSIVAMTSGTVASINVSEGDWISAGQSILTISNASISTSLQSANNGITSAELTLDTAQLSADTAQRNLEITEDLIDDYEITAPISGVIASLGFDVGDEITATNMATAAIVEIFDLSSMEFTMYVDELEISNIKAGQTVIVTSDSFDGLEFEGVVEKVTLSGISTSGVTNYPITVRLTEYGELLPGMNVSAEIIVEEVDQVLSIPIEAVSRGNTVLIVDSSSKGDAEDSVPAGYSRVIIELGSNDSDYIEVLSGLSETDQVVIDTSTASMMEMMASGSVPMG